MYDLYCRKEDYERHSLVRARVEERLGENDQSKLSHIYEGLDRKALYHNGLKFGRALLEDEIKHHHG
ncbi:hypothetical protein H0H93_002148, partial [Arthromyces matolae]